MRVAEISSCSSSPCGEKVSIWTRPVGLEEGFIHGVTHGFIRLTELGKTDVEKVVVFVS